MYGNDRVSVFRSVLRSTLRFATRNTLQLRPPHGILRWNPVGGGNRSPGPGRRKPDFVNPDGSPFSFENLPLITFALAATGAALFLPAVPLWCAGLPLLMAIATRWSANRFLLAFAFFFWPAMVAMLGLTALGYHPLPVALGLGFAAALLPFLMAWLGVVPVGLALLLIPVFPAGPLPALVDALPGPVPLTGLGLLLVGLLIVEGIPLHLTRIFLLLFFCGGLGAGHLFAAIYADRTGAPRHPPAWVEHPVPTAITDHAARIRLRDSLPRGSEAILGENLFTEDDVEALTFWWKAARDRDLTLWIGVEARDGRGTLLRLLPGDTDTLINPEPVAAARYGIPGITGTWRAMPPLADGDTGIDWLFCYEVLLPQAWASLLSAHQPPDRADTRPIVVLASDRWLGPLPFHVTRRKLARAMAGMAGRRVYFAETGRTFLLRNTEEWDG